jgi:hypothetical protein
MTFPLMPLVQSALPTPVVTFCGSADNFPTSMTSLGADDPNRFLVITRSSGSSTSDAITCTVGGVSQTVWYPQSSGAVTANTTGYAQFVIVSVPTGTSVATSATGNTGGKTAWYTVTGLAGSIPFNGRINAGNPASGSVTMIENGIVFASLWSDNDNNSFTWSSPLIRTVNDTSLGASRGASMAYRSDTPSGAYTVSVSMAIGNMYMGAIVLR